MADTFISGALGWARGVLGLGWPGVKAVGPRIITFTVTVNVDNSVTLTWDVVGGTAVINNGVGPVSGSGTTTVYPPTSTVYTITVTGGTGSPRVIGSGYAPLALPPGVTLVPMAIDTFFFNIWHKTFRNVGGWSPNQLIYQGDSGGICSAGAQTVDDDFLKLGILVPEDVPVLGNNATCFAGNGTPHLKKPIEAAGLPGRWFMEDYWDMSQGAWHWDNKYWAFLLGEDDGQYHLLSSPNGYREWTAHDGLDNYWAVRRTYQYVDVIFETSGTNIKIATYDLSNGGAKTEYGEVDIGFAFGAGQTQNNVLRFDNDDIGFIFGTNTGPGRSVYYKLYSASTGAWGPNILVSSSGLSDYYANALLSSDHETIHFIRGTILTSPPGTVQPVYDTISHYGTVINDIFTFAQADGGTDGVGHSIVFEGNLYIAYDIWDDEANAVWVGPEFGSLTKELLPLSDGEVGNPSCAYMVIGRYFPPRYNYARITQLAGLSIRDEGA